MRFVRMKIISICKARNSDHDYVIKVEMIPGFLARFFGRRSVYRVYQGEPTIFHNVKTGIRPGTMIESFLSDKVWLHENQRRLTLLVEKDLESAC